jgi:hypothetical protein
MFLQAQANRPVWNSFILEKERIFLKLSRDIAAKASTDLPTDNKDPALPPKQLLISVLDGYFRYINIVTPLLERTAVEENLDRTYAEPTPNLAWIMIFTYIAVRCLAGRFSSLDGPIDDIQSVTGPSFIKPYLANAKRVLTLLDQLMAPSLVNVQAIVALVSRSSLLHSSCFSCIHTGQLTGLRHFLLRGSSLYTQLACSLIVHATSQRLLASTNSTPLRLPRPNRLLRSDTYFGSYSL